MKGRVTGSNVAIKPDVVEKTSKGGIVLAQQYDQNLKLRTEKGSTKGVVIDIGPDAFVTTDPDWKPYCKVGDKVHFVRHTSKFIEDEDDLDEDSKPKQIFITQDVNIVWNEDAEDE